MGSRPSAASTTYIPATVAPTIFQSVVPEEDFARAAKRIQELKTEREAAKAERYAEIGTPEEIRARMDKRNKVTEAAYESSLPEPEIDYTAGLDPARLNNLDTFLTKLVERRQGKGKASASVSAPVSAPKIDSADAVRKAIQAPAPKVAPRPAPAPAPAPRPAPAPAPTPYNEGKWGSKWGAGSYSTEELRKRFGLAYSKELEEEAKTRRSAGMYNEEGDIWGKSSTGKDVYLGKAHQGLYGNEELISGHARQADAGEKIHKDRGENLSSIGDRAGGIWNVWKRD